MKNFQPNSLRGILGLSVFLLLLMSADPNILHAQNVGRISGTVIEGTTKSPLPGANISIEGTAKGAASGQNGKYTIFELRPDSYTVTVTFLGYQDVSKDVEVAAGQVAEVNFEMEETILTGEGVVVYGDLARGQAKSLQRQKIAQNIVQVVSEEFFSKFPDRNAAETVRRLPSVSISRDQGEGEFIQIRGMAEEYNSVTLNGIRIPSPDEHDGARSVGLDLINNRLLSEIEITKALTPEMDGDAIGGVVNFGLRRAPVGGTAVIGIGAGYNDQISDFNTYGRGIADAYGLWGDRFLDNKLGLLIDGAYFRTSRHSKLKELNYLNEGDTGPYSNEIYQQHTNDYDLIRERYGFSVSADYEFNALNRIYATYNQNAYLDNEIRREVEYRIEDEEEERTTRNRVEDQRLNLIMAGGEHNLGWFNFDYKGAYITTSEHLPDRTYLRYERDNPTLATVSNDEVRDYDGTTKFSGLDPLALNRVRWDDNLKKDDDLSGQINFVIPFPFMSGDRSNVKFGAKYLKKSVSYDVNRWQIGDFTEDLTTPEGTFGFEDVRWHSPELTPYYDEEPSVRDNYLETYDANEKITSVYGMMQLNFTPKIAVLGGLRFEATNTDYTQPYPDQPELIGDDPLQGSGSYQNLLPSIHLKYLFDKNNNLKLAYSTGLARPRYTQLVPTMVVDVASSNSDLNGSISYGNPALKPRTAYNYDIMYDRFTPYLGVISVGLFYKRFKAWHTTETWAELHDFVNDDGDEEPDGIPETYRASKPVMGDGTADFYGFEINLQQRLNIISSAMKWFALNVNYTHTISKGEIDGREVVMTRSPKHIANASLMYDNTDIGLSVVLAANYRDAILGGLEVTDYGPDKYLDSWFDSEFFIDLMISQKITQKLQIIAQLNGMGRTDEHEVLGDPREDYSRTQQWEKYGLYGTIGLQYTFW